MKKISEKCKAELKPLAKRLYHAVVGHINLSPSEDFDRLEPDTQDTFYAMAAEVRHEDTHAAYEEAMGASNEAGYAGMTAAVVIRDMLANQELTVELQSMRLMHAAEGELDGLAIDLPTAKRIMRYVVSGKVPEEPKAEKPARALPPSNLTGMFQNGT